MKIIISTYFKSHAYVGWSKNFAICMTQCETAMIKILKKEDGIKMESNQLSVESIQGALLLFMPKHDVETLDL
jgi:hypothetical protein